MAHNCANFLPSERILLACVERRFQNPNPWARSLSFTHLLSALILGKNILGPHTIKAHQDSESITALQTFWEKRVADAEARAKKRAEEYQKEQEQYLKDLEEVSMNLPLLFLVDLDVHKLAFIASLIDWRYKYRFECSNSWGFCSRPNKSLSLSDSAIPEGRVHLASCA